jgi:pyruvate formate lyase activating enzyme
VDLKGFSEEFYHRHCYGALAPVLETLQYLRHQTTVWFEVTTLLIPGENDSEAELDRVSNWFAANLGPEVPWHFTAFHPDYKMLDPPCTPPATLTRARAIARSKGLRYVYTGNVHDRDGSSTWCPGCGQRLVERDGYVLGAWKLKRNRCAACGFEIAGQFDEKPGNWGARRVPVRLN